MEMSEGPAPRLRTGRIRLPLPNLLRRRINVTHVVVLLFAVALAGTEPPSPAHVRNFGQVDKTLYRGAEPSALGLQELGAAGVKIIVDLRESGQATIRERQQAEQLGMKYVNVPFPPFSAPANEQVRTVLQLLLNHGSQPLFLHCRRGKDRTGTMIACYRVQHDGWTNIRALAEANEYGMSRAEREMRSFVRHFSPLSQSALFPGVRFGLSLSDLTRKPYRLSYVNAHPIFFQAGKHNLHVLMEEIT